MDMWMLQKLSRPFLPDDFFQTILEFDRLCRDTYPDNVRLYKDIKNASKPNPEPIPEPDSELETGLERFRKAHAESYETALREIRSGMKMSHWMRYIFPQIQGFRRSSTAQYYAIKDREEAIAYWQDPVLSAHLLEISRELLKLNSSIEWIMGYPDDLKLKSCMTLFWLVTGENAFEEVLNKFYVGEMDEFTRDALS